MDIILDFEQDLLNFNTLTSSIEKELPKISIDLIVKTAYEHFHTFVANTIEQIDRALALKLKDNPNITLISKRNKTIKTPYGKFMFSRRYYKYELGMESYYYYPLDDFLGIRPRTQYTDGCKLVMAFKASDLTYRQVGENISNEFNSCKSSVYRFIKNINVEQIIPEKIDDNKDEVVHIQIDEKYVPVNNQKYKKRLYTATIFKGRYFYGENKNKAKLLNKTVFSSNSINNLALKANKLLSENYKLTEDDVIYLSGDLATYIQNFGERITTCKSIYVPDKFHVFRDIKKFTGEIVSVDSFSTLESINNILKSLESITDEKILKNPNYKKLVKLLKKKPQSLMHYNDEKYHGCSQECMNSRIYSVRFGKNTNKFNFDTILKLSEIKEAVLNKSKLSLKFTTGDCYIHTPIKSIEKMEMEKYVININEYPPSLRKIFAYIIN